MNISFLSCLFACTLTFSVTGQKPLFESKRITRATPGHQTAIDVDIRGAKKLFLVVSDGGDGHHSDWANWAEPRLIGPKGELKLTSLKWISATSGWGQVHVDENANGTEMKIDGKPVSYGIGTHANSIIAYKLPAGYERFVASGGIDNGGTDQGNKSSVIFSVYKQRPKQAKKRGRPQVPEIKATSVPLDMFTLADDLEIKVWAQSPLFYNPTNIDIDAAGRIWVAEGMNYRGSKKRPEGDRIVVLEDTDGDGIADSSHVFVQDKNLISPLGLAVIGNQIVVAQPPDMLVYTDVDGDLRYDPAIDRREKLLSGFHGRNHDHSLHSVTVGPDGLWYFNHGNKGSTFTDHSGKTFRIGSGYSNQGEAGKKSDDGHVWVGGTAFRMRPDGTEVAVIGHNFRNSYEQCVTSYGDVFQNDNDDPPNCRTSWLMEFGNAGYSSNDGKRNWRADLRPGQTTQIAHWRQEDPGSMPAGDIYGGGAPTGIVFYENGALGDHYAGLLLSCESAKNVIFGYHPKPTGAGFALERTDFLTSNPQKEFAGADFRGGRGSLKTLFRPSDVAVGPDGAIYVADWFDPRVGGHATHDKLGSGTIYRIAPKGAQLRVPAIDMHTIAGQITALKSPAVNVRALGFTALKKQGRAALPAVRALLDDPDHFIRARAVWLLVQLGKDGRDSVKGLLAHEDPQMRIVAFRALHRIDSNGPDVAKTLAVDPSPGVRREIAIALRDARSSAKVELVLALAQRYDGYDRWYLEALGTACTGWENLAYVALLPELGPNVAAWSEAFARIAWRLHPASAVPHFKQRAFDANLPIKARKLAIDSLAFVANRPAGQAMLELAAGGPKDTTAHATWWLRNRHNNDWREFNFIAKLPAQAAARPAAVTLVASSKVSTLPSIDEILALTGDAARGKALFSGRATCFACHQVKGKGGTIGPDLTDAAQKFDGRILLVSMIDPSAEISLGFEATQLTKKDRNIVTGYVVGEGDPLLIRDLTGVQHAIDAKDIKAREKLSTSLMPPVTALGLEAQDLADLVAYLRSLR